MLQPPRSDGIPGSTGDPDSPTRLPGLTVPGLANCHSHAFHRALRGRTQRGQGTFWTWREQMYAVAERLDPDSYLALATATFREMVAAGIACVGEFHYLHHQPDGTPYDDPNAMGQALLEAARTAGLRITLLDTCYLAAGIGRPVEGVQRRFSDGDVDGWSARVDALTPTDGARIGAAYHSVRAVPRDQMRATTPSPLHIHLSEQVAENEQCLAAYGLSPDAGLRRGRPPDRPEHAGPRDPPHRRRRPAHRRGAARTSTSAPRPSATSATASGPAARSATPVPG